jgi:broad specificity phosphatase PhoE
VEQARANGRRLLAHLGQAATEFNFIASPMNRARHTMELVLAELGLPTDNYRTDQRLCEAAYGDWEGLTIDEIQREAGPAFDAREKDRWHFAPPGGESLQMAMERVLPVLETVETKTIIVAHGAVGRTVRKVMLGLDETEAGQFVFRQDRIFRFEGGVEQLI